MNKNINLAMLNKREEELTKKEMKVVKGREIACDCNRACKKGNCFEIVYQTQFDAAFYTDITCKCSIWATFGLQI